MPVGMGDMQTVPHFVRWLMLKAVCLNMANCQPPAGGFCPAQGLSLSTIPHTSSITLFLQVPNDEMRDIDNEWLGPLGGCLVNDID
jgi:hypothetical protein